MGMYSSLSLIWQVNDAIDDKKCAAYCPKELIWWILLGSAYLFFQILVHWKCELLEKFSFDI